MNPNAYARAAQNYDERHMNDRGTELLWATNDHRRYQGRPKLKALMKCHRDRWPLSKMDIIARLVQVHKHWNIARLKKLYKSNADPDIGDELSIAKKELRGRTTEITIPVDHPFRLELGIGGVATLTWNRDELWHSISTHLSTATDADTKGKANIPGPSPNSVKGSSASSRKAKGGSKDRPQNWHALQRQNAAGSQDKSPAPDYSDTDTESNDEEGSDHAD